MHHGLANVVNAPMLIPLHLLIVEDDEDDAFLILSELVKNGFDPQWKRVMRADEFATALASGRWDLILCDFRLPRFSGAEALKLYRASGLDMPFIIVSGTIGDEAAVEAMRGGAHDYVSKDKMWRLAPAVERELREAQVRRDRRESEAALRDSERKYRSVIEQASDGIAICESSGRFLEANSRALRMAGYTQEEAREKSILDVLDPDEVTSHPIRVLTLAPGESQLIRRNLVRKDGSKFSTEINSTVLDDGRIVSILRDITGQVHAEDILRRREEQQRAMADIGRLAASAAEVSEVLAVAGRLAAEALRMDFCRVVESDDAGELTVRFNTGWPLEHVLCGLSHEVLVEFAAADEPVMLQSIDDIAQCDCCRELDVRCGLTAVLGSTERPVGLIALHSREPHAFSEDDLAFLASLAALVGEAVHRKRSEERLLASENELAQAQRIANLGSWTWDVSTDMFDGSDESYRLLGVDRAAGPLPVERILDFVVPSSIAAVEELLREGRAGHAVEGAFEIVSADGVRRVLYSRSNPTAGGAYGFVQDITQSRANEARIRESEQRLARAQRIANVGSWEYDLENRRTSWSDHLCRMMGREPGVVIDGRDVSFVRESGRRAFLDAMRRVVETGIGQVIEDDVTRADGTVRRMLVHMEAQRDTSGRVVKINGTSQDITELRKAEAERQALAREIELLLESTYEGIYATDREGRCTLVNRAACAMLGYAPDELLGRDLHLVVHDRRADGSPYPLDECPIGIAAAQASPRQLIDEVLWRKDGRSLPVEIFVSPIIDERGDARGLVVSFADATEKRLLHDELERANRLSSLGRVAATMSHEFNNVLMGIQPFAEIIARAAVDERVTAAAQQIQNSVHRGRKVTQELLRFTRPADPVRQAVDVKSFLDGCAVELRVQLPPTLTLDVSAADGLCIAVDRDQLAQVISNLVLNARDAIGDREGHITLAAAPCGAEQHFAYGVVPNAERFVLLSVTDDGPGIGADDARRMFEPFFTTKKKGTGLGLAISHQIVRLHGGHIFVETQPGRGTTMHCFLPVAVAEALPALIPSERSERVGVA